MNQRMEPLAATAGAAEALLEAAGVVVGYWITPARGRDFVALGVRHDAAQQRAQRVDGVDDSHSGAPDFLPSPMTFRSCVGPKTCSCHRSSTRSSASSSTATAHLGPEELRRR